MDFSCKCGKRFGQLVRDDTKAVLCPKCGRSMDLEKINEQIEEARRSILDKPGDLDTPGDSKKQARE